MSPSAPSLSRILRDAIARHASAGRIAVTGPSGPIGYAELGERIDRFAGGVRDCGVARGERVAILAPRDVETVALYFGIMQAGGCPCFLEPRLKADEIGSRLRAVGVRRLVTGETEQVDLDSLAAEIELITVASLRGSTALRDAQLGPNDDAMMQFTSGSTGQPKSVLLTHGNLLANAAGVIAHTGVGPEDRLLHVMPLHHTNGINNQLVVPFLAGATVILIDRFKAEETATQIARFGATYITAVPTMYARILPHLGDRAQLASLRFLRCGSAPLAVALHEQIEDAFGVPLVVSYGLSEATCTSTMNPPAARRIGTVGTVLAGQQVKLFHPGTRDEVLAGTDGEVCIGGASLMKGYVGATAEQPIRDSWLRTGDLGRFDSDGYLSITGRIKDIIIRAGENLSPQMIEGALASHPAVKACCVVGGPHRDLGEVPIAFVVLRDGPRVSGEDLQAHVTERLSRTYVPAEIRFETSLPENAVGKLDRKALRQRV